jgi:peptidoglycan/xylan/chitin deacetylase (PgdA/CDA1 family)
VRDVIVLTYHAVSEAWPAELSVLPDRLDVQLREIVRRGYVGATFSQAVTAPPAEKTVSVTFDDAYRSVIELAFPILAAHGLPGTVFTPTDFVATERPMAWPGIDRWLGGPHEHELVPMSWDELARLAAAGWEIGAHGRTHPRLTQLADTVLDDELRGSRAACEAHLGRPCESLAYPYGDADARVVAAAARAGYRAATGPRLMTGHSQELCFPRMGVWHDDDMARFRKKISPLVRRAWRSPAWSLVQRLSPVLDR